MFQRVHPGCVRVPRARTGRPLGEPFPGSIVSDHAKGVPEMAPKGTKYTRLFSLDTVSLADGVQQLFPGKARCPNPAQLGCWVLEVGGCGFCRVKIFTKMKDLP